MSGDGERQPQIEPSADEGDAAASVGQRILNIGGLVLIAAVFAVLMLRIGGRGDDPSGATRSVEVARDSRTSAGERTTERSSGQFAAIGGHNSISLPPLLRPEDPGVPDREPLAGLPGAVERFGEMFMIRHPAYLPADVAPFTVNWQPDHVPERRAQGFGELFTWFYSTEHGAVLLLAQGPGAGVWPLTADDDRAGRVRLADGTEAVWVIGHPTSVTGSIAGGPVWEGTEITLGIPATNGEGWYLSSPIVGLEELIRVANSLELVTARQ
ncbi:MAG: hypothetical protein AB7R89_17505 [Dehalococcoidia bacterium]